MKMIKVVKASNFINLNEAFDNSKEVYIDDELLEEAKSYGILTDSQIEKLKMDFKHTLKNGVYEVSGSYLNDNFDYDSMLEFKELLNEPNIK